MACQDGLLSLSLHLQAPMSMQGWREREGEKERSRDPRGCEGEGKTNVSFPGIHFKACLGPMSHEYTSLSLSLPPPHTHPHSCTADPHKHSLQGAQSRFLFTLFTKIGAFQRQSWFFLLKSHFTSSHSGMQE